MKEGHEIQIIGTSSSSVLHLQAYNKLIVSSNKKGYIEVKVYLNKYNIIGMGCGEERVSDYNSW